MPKQISADASLQTHIDGVTLTYTGIHLTVRAQVECSQEEAVREAAALARDTCPIARVLKAPVTMDLQFDRQLYAQANGSPGRYRPLEDIQSADKPSR